MLKHILTGQPSSAGSRHQHNDYQASSGSLHGGHHHHHHHSGHQQDQQQHHHYNQNSNVRGTTGGSQGRGVDVYDSVVHQRANVHQAATTPSSTHRHPLNHSQLSVNNLSQRLNHSHALNLSTLSTSKHSVNSVSPVAGGNNNNNNNNNLSTTLGVISPAPLHQDSRPKANGGFDISRPSRLPSQATPSPAPALQGTTTGGQLTGPGSTAYPLNASWSSSLSRNHKDHEVSAKETLTSLGLLCLVSLLLALLSLIFLLKISPLTVTPSSLISPEEYTIVYEVTLALCALALSLNLCCLLMCAIQFLFTVKLVKTSYQGHW
ncbi:nuclear transcription factor Y subunit gamma-like [Bombus vosnesenskii]|uniref:Nuclear transcription factor Y subunit gamma-like n=1 Tax=Bombus vosnesenskii TaxID=207650 RepID=A0A6J3LAG3_9HYME|nr:nuclear transcription factor Y subunit gamma-like [Bombus vosnesenskii]